MSRPDELVADRYRLVERIAAGGMGSVWEAWDERLHRRVALKQLHPQPGLGADEARLAGNRAMREARITARLHHAHAVPVYDVVDYDGQPCLVMQYLPSKSLQALLTERGVLAVAEVARIGSEVAAALSAAHSVGIVHRDVKPGNVLIEPDGTAKLTDFGISHALGDVALTSTGMVTGTPAFLAPEMARGLDSSFASDVFSLGSTLYAAVEGAPPFGTADNPMATLHRVASGQIAPPQRAGGLAPILSHMLATDPDQRPSMQEVTRELRAVANDPNASAQTQHFAAAPRPAAPPPSTTMSLPPVGPRPGPPVGARPGPPVPVPPGPPPSRDRRGRGWLIGLLALVLLGGAAIALVTNLPGGGGSPSTGAAGPSRSTSAKSSPSSRPASSSSSGTSSASSSRASSSSTKASTTASSATTNGTAASADQLKKAIRDYYGLLPDDTNAGWQRLTPSYQSGHAGGRRGYERFWADFVKVSTSSIQATPPGTVVATITYERKDGSKSVERTTFGLVRQAGVLKIDTSSVVG